MNLGRILINFLNFYGSFDHENMGISSHLPACRASQQVEMKANQYPLLNVSNQCCEDLPAVIVLDDAEQVCDHRRPHEPSQQRGEELLQVL